MENVKSGVPLTAKDARLGGNAKAAAPVATRLAGTVEVRAPSVRAIVMTLASVAASTPNDKSVVLVMAIGVRIVALALAVAVAA